MIVGGLTRAELTLLADSLGFELNNLRRQGRRSAFQIKVRGDRYRRLRTHPRKDGTRTRTAFPCFHGYRDFVHLVFAAGAMVLLTSIPGGAYAGLHPIGTSTGRWKSWEEFENDLPAFKTANLGSPAYRVYMYELCEC